MSQNFETPQDAEDAFYDALEEKDLDAFLQIWESSNDVACLLPMQPLLTGPDNIRTAWSPMFKDDINIDVQVRHLRWIETDDLAIHYVEEIVQVPGQGRQPPLFATKIYRKGNNGWRLILHQNSPPPPPPGLMQPK